MRLIEFMFKLYPWEWLLADEFGKYIKPDAITLFEPAWKMVLSNKGILPVLWEMFPGHKNLLPSYFDQSRLGDSFVKKPLFAREGANIEFRRGDSVISTEGTYGSEGFIYQELKELLHSTAGIRSLDRGLSTGWQQASAFAKTIALSRKTRATLCRTILLIDW